MPTSPLPPEATAFLARPNIATMSTVRRDGAPVSVPTWYLFENDHIVVNLDAGRTRLAHLRHDGRMSLSAMDPDDWYTHISLQGRVASITDDVDLVDIDRISTHYGGGPYPVRDRPRVTVVVEVERFHGWGNMKGAE
ncbi:PPOX class F420-dependent enzyme [Humibacillus sp. DSM 29435]|uniref:TIGR03618 family F420-dependent PPOX class oxidoreductase n=1 Tax=Humibacillus sp. DSM 29435 TaxID=1869167 RepID=UPI000871EB73|nr:TIGR03618 family F420-dependent PPOX class oxidoreductase [Humibacillus sp. DSM 29435]OFE18969.1 PPOX class F420-dependent enzyme [Humibacillus sp. DSM 29435]